MALLHERKEDFFDAINLASQKYNIIPAVVEKDYYVTMILRELSERLAICDYYLQDRVKKHSRHIYDIYKLLAIVKQDAGFRQLVCEVRTERAKTSICPSAQPEVDVPELLNLLVDKNIYRDDYESITSRILEEQVSYDTAIEAVKTIAKSGMFAINTDN